jgi:hypothetical protein
MISIAALQLTVLPHFALPRQWVGGPQTKVARYRRERMPKECKRPKIVYAEIGINEFMPSSGLCRVSPRNIAKSQNLSVEARHNPESLSTA